MRYVARNCSIKTMMQGAYRVRAEQIVGGPPSMDTAQYDMDAKAEKPSNADELHVMVMNMLVDRMQFKFHREKQEMLIYALTIDHGGPKLTRHEAGNAHDTWIDFSEKKLLHRTMTATSVPLDYFTFQLGHLMDLPVVDLTGVKGFYDFTLSYTRDLPLGFPEGGKINGEDPDTSGPDIFQAVKQQLGLELKAQRGPVEVFAIDHAEKPSEN